MTLSPSEQELYNLKLSNIQQVIASSVKRVSVDVRKKLYQAVRDEMDSCLVKGVDKPLPVTSTRRRMSFKTGELVDPDE